MSVLVKGMQMPTVGRILIVFPSGRVLEVSVDATQNIFRETQSVPVPPHGRLIEKNAVFKLIQSMPSVDKLLPVEFMKALQEIPTVIEAEEGE